MIKCPDCRFFYRESTTLPDGMVILAPMGQCRHDPPQVTVVPSAAVFGNISASPLDPGIPGWTIGCNIGSMYPPVKDDWGCGRGEKREDE